MLVGVNSLKIDRAFKEGHVGNLLLFIGDDCVVWDGVGGVGDVCDVGDDRIVRGVRQIQPRCGPYPAAAYVEVCELAHVR